MDGWKFGIFGISVALWMIVEDLTSKDLCT